MSGSFTDPQFNIAHVVTIDWGDETAGSPADTTTIDLDPGETTFQAEPNSTTYAAAGTYPISVTVTGVDGTATASTPIAVTATTTTLSAPSSQSYGQPVTLTATVASVVSGSGTPTGTVDFYDQTTGIDLGTASLASGVASLSVSGLALGDHDIVAAYSGDENFPASASSPGTVSIIGQSLAIDNIQAPSTVTKGSIVTLSADVENLNGAGFTLTINWGSYQGSSVGVTYPAGTTSFSLTHHYVDSGFNPFIITFPVAISVTSTDGRTASDTQDIQGQDTSPVVSVGYAESSQTIFVLGYYPISLQNLPYYPTAPETDPAATPDGIETGSQISLSAVVADYGEYGSFEYTWTISGGPYTNVSGQGTSSFSFLATGTGNLTYTVTLVVTDGDGSTVTKYQTFLVPGYAYSPFNVDQPTVTVQQCDQYGNPITSAVPAGQNAYFQIGVSGYMPNEGAVTVYYTTANGSAVANTDYTASGDQSHTFYWDPLTGGYDPYTVTIPTSPTSTGGNFYLNVPCLFDQYAAIPGSGAIGLLASAVATVAPAPQLIAQTVNTSSVGLTATLGANGLSTGDLPHSDEAYVPLSNESQVYGSEDNSTTSALTQDKDYAGAIPNDKFLLPVEVTGTANSTLALSTSGNGIRLWGNANRSGQPISSVTIGASGTSMIFVEGLQQGEFNVLLGANPNAPLDTLTVNVFTFSGPQDVPNYSTYDYGVSGAQSVLGEEDPWSVQTENSAGAVQSGQGSLGLFHTTSASVRWGTGGDNGYGQISYQIDGNYTWSYYVNVVSMTISNPHPITTQQPTGGAISLVRGSRFEQISTQGHLVTGRPGGYAYVTLALRRL